MNFFIFLFFFSQETTNIYVYNNEYYDNCPGNCFNSSSKIQFEKYLMSLINKDKNIKIYLYSRQDGFIFSFNSAKLTNYNITFQTLHESQSVQLKIKQGLFWPSKTIELKANYEVNLQDLIPYQIRNIPSKKHVLESDPTEIPQSVGISVGISHMQHENSFQCFFKNGTGIALPDTVDSKTVGCPTENLHTEGAYNCGLRCYTNNNGNLMYKFTGVKFVIIGTKDNGHGTFEIQLDGEHLDYVDTKAQREEFVPLYTSKILDYKEHSIKILANNNVYEFHKLVYWPSLTAKRLNITEIVNKSGSWIIESDGIGGTRQYSDSKGTLIIPMHCKKFWVYGLRTNEGYYKNRKINIKYGDVSIDASLEDNERKLENCLIYESEEIEDFHFNLNLTSNFMFNFVYYEDLPMPISVGLVLMKNEGVFKCNRVGDDGKAWDLSGKGIGDVGCSTDVVASSRCGARCWTDGNSLSSCNLEYSFTGVKFALYGTFDPNHHPFDILIDNQKVGEVDENSLNRREYSVIYTSRNLEYREHKIRIQTKGQAYEMYKLAYWPSLNCKRINSTELTKVNGTWRIQTDGIGGVQMYADSNGVFSTVMTKMHCSKFWIYGLKDRYGDGRHFTLEYNGIVRQADVHSTSRTEIQFLYESEDLSMFDVTLKITGHSMISAIYYEVPPIPISVSLDQMETNGTVMCKYSDNGNEFPLTNNVDHSTLGCEFNNLNSPNAYQCGLRCRTTDGVYNYRFIGVKFAVYGARNLGPFDIELDDEIIETVTSKSEQNDFALLYESDIYSYKEHRVRLISKNSNFMIYKIAYWPSYKAKRMNITQFKKEGQWRKQSDGIGGAVEYCDNSGCTAKTNIKCTQFWVYGTTDSNLQGMTLSYNGKTETINQQSDSKIDGVLLYKSPGFEERNVELTFTSSGPSNLYCIYYDRQPQPTITPVPISVSIQQLTREIFNTGQNEINCTNHRGEYISSDYSGDYNCNLNDVNSRDSYQCGMICTVFGLTFSYKFRGVKCAIIGQKMPQSAITVAVDAEPEGYEDIKGELKDDYEVLWESDILTYGDHTLKFTAKYIDTSFRLHKVVYWPTLNGKRINTTDIALKSDDWTTESDRIGGTWIKTTTVSSFAKKIECTRFWIYGTYSGEFELTFDGHTDTILNSENKLDPILFNESTEFVYHPIELKLKSKGPLYLNFIYYVDAPSRTFDYIDKSFDKLLPYYDIYIPSDSFINQISGCDFTSIAENLDYIITLEKEVKFYDNIFHEGEGDHPSIIEIKYTGSISIKNCSFLKARGKPENKASIFYSGKDYTIEATFQECIFIDCGQWTDQPLIKIENGLSTINVINSSFYDPDYGTITQPLNVLISNAKLHNCSFKQLGGIYLNQPSGSYRSGLNEISITNCTFFSCRSQKNPCTIDIQIHQESTLVFDGNEITDITTPEDGTCILSINTDGKAQNINILNCLFANLTCYSYGGGGSGIQIKKASKIVFENCSFINNHAGKCQFNRTDFAFPDTDQPYFNGDGGGIQIGFECDMNVVDVTFERCNFTKNKAVRHGGAISIQTLKAVEITDCIFESNFANLDFDEADLLETHYYKKTEGRGGAIYINPSYSYKYKGQSCFDTNLYMNPVTIKGCTFIGNSARDGYAMYIEGDDPGTEFTIEGNNFTNNYNFVTEDEEADPNITIRGVITTEIHSISEKMLPKNKFYDVKYRKLIYVDHYGNRVPTKGFSESGYFSYSTYFTNSVTFTESNDFSNSAKFTESNSFSNSAKFSESGKFTKSNNFLPSENFTKSKVFSQSNKFSETQEFTNSAKLTESNDFSESNKFTKSNNFLPSENFTKSKGFSQSSKFSETQGFTNSAKFSESNDFSESNKFTKSNNFLPSENFTKSKVFSQSNKFSETQGFTNSAKFSETKDFSFSSDFTKSVNFLPSSNFTESKGFTQSGKFSETSIFSSTMQFSNTEKFTETSYFSISCNFSRSNPFSESFEFSKTTKFSLSSKFSHTEHFSLTDHFTYTNSFSKSNDFSQSFAFSQSNKFTSTTGFSSSSQFSKSKPFDPSIQFTNSHQFSNSLAFSPSEELPFTDPKCSVFDNGEFTILNNCRYKVDTERLVYIFVISSNFSNYEQEEDGSAINLYNCGILCNNTQFVDCVSKSGAGGAIYIDNSFEITNNATFIKTEFHRNKAQYGGAIYLSAQSNLFDISFTECLFQSNEAFKKNAPSTGNKNLYGGQALFIISQGVNVSNCSFVQNKGKGGSVKFLITLDDKSKSILLENDQKSFNFFGCNFDQLEFSESSIDIIDKESRNPIEFVDCIFKGKLKKGSHYINGKMHNKEKLRTKSCIFENDVNEAINIMNVELQSDVYLKDDLFSFNFNLLIVSVGLILISALLIGFIWKSKILNDTQLENDTFYNDNQNSLI